MPRNRYGGVGLPEDDTEDVTAAVEVEGENEDTVEAVARYARNAAVRAMEAIESGTHPDKIDFTDDVAAVDWDTVLDDGDPKGDTDEDGDDGAEE